MIHSRLIVWTWICYKRCHVVLTRSVGLQVPGPPGASGQDGGGQGGVNGTTGLHVPFLVPGCWDLQDRDRGALIQLSSGRQHLCESLLAHADVGLQGAVQNHVWFEPQEQNNHKGGFWLFLTCYSLVTSWIPARPRLFVQCLFHSFNLNKSISAGLWVIFITQRAVYVSASLIFMGWTKY